MYDIILKNLKRPVFYQVFNLEVEGTTYMIQISKDKFSSWNGNKTLVKKMPAYKILAYVCFWLHDRVNFARLADIQHLTAPVNVLQEGEQQYKTNGSSAVPCCGVNDFLNLGTGIPFRLRIGSSFVRH